MKLGKKKNAPEAVEEKEEDFLAQEAKEMEEQAPEYTLDIPEDEIWTYKIEGLQAPSVGKSYDGARVMKVLVIVIILIAISLSIFFSINALKTTEYDYKEVKGGYELVSYSNPGSVRDVTIDYVDGDKSKPVVSLHDYAFNCDGAIEKVHIGKDVNNINGTTFYSCWNIQYVDIDDENPYYCDVDGVVYTKDMSKIIFYPTDYDRTLRIKNGYAHLVWECESCGRQYDEKKGDPEGGIAAGTKPEDMPKDYKCPGNNGKKCNSRGNEYYWAYHSDLKEDDGKTEMWELWGTTEKYNEAFLKEYNLKTRTYVIPSTVTEIGQLAFAYSNITDLYMPEGIKVIGPQAIFKNEILQNIYSYKSDKPVNDTFYTAIPSLGTIYDSIPEGVEEIGSDAFYHLRGLDYMYIPSSVNKIGHHLMWEAIYKDDNTKELMGITEVNVAKSEDEFKSSTEHGEKWIPEYNNGLFSKKVPVNYGAERRAHVDK